MPGLLKIAIGCAALSAGIAPGFAGNTLAIEQVGISVTVPDSWNHDDSDEFGFLIRVDGEKQKKIRVHLTPHKNISPAEAVQRGTETVNQRRNEKRQPPESILKSEPIITASGIPGSAAEVGYQGAGGPSSLTRMYFLGTNGRIFCTCIYHFGDMQFAESAKVAILETLVSNP